MTTKSDKLKQVDIIVVADGALPESCLAMACAGALTLRKAELTPVDGGFDLIVEMVFDEEKFVVIGGLEIS